MSSVSDADKPRQLFQSISDKDMKVAKLVVNSHPNPQEIVNYENKSGFTTLMMAVQLLPEDDAVLYTEFVLKCKPLIDKVNKLGQTALMLATKKGYAKVVSVLVKNNANYELRNPVSVYSFDKKSSFTQFMLYFRKGKQPRILLLMMQPVVLSLI